MADDADGSTQRSEQGEQAVEREAGTRDDPEETALQALERGWQGASLARELSDRAERGCRFVSFVWSENADQKSVGFSRKQFRWRVFRGWSRTAIFGF